MNPNLVLSLTLSAFTFLPLAAQPGAAPSTPDNQNPPQSSQSSPDSNAPQDTQKPDVQPNADDKQNAYDQQNEKVPVYRVTVVERTTQAVDYRDRGGTTQVDFKGTALTPAVDGNAKVTGHTGRLAIDANSASPGAAAQLWSGIPHVCSVGHHAGRPSSEHG